MNPFKMELNVEKLKRMQREYTEEYGGMCGISADHVLIRSECMTQVAPLSEWTLNIPIAGIVYPFEHYIIVDGVKFSALTAGKL